MSPITTKFEQNLRRVSAKLDPNFAYPSTVCLGNKEAALSYPRSQLSSDVFLKLTSSIFDYLESISAEFLETVEGYRSLIKLLTCT